MGLGYRYVVFRKEGHLRPRPQRDGSTRMESDWPRARRILREVDSSGRHGGEDDELALYTLGGAPLECEAAAPAPEGRGRPLRHRRRGYQSPRGPPVMPMSLVLPSVSS